MSPEAKQHRIIQVAVFHWCEDALTQAARKRAQLGEEDLEDLQVRGIMSCRYHQFS